MDLKTSIQNKQSEFLTLCRTYDVEKLYAFGSSTNGNFNEATSDIDLLVELSTEDPAERGQKLMDLWDKLEIFFQRKIDLLSNKPIRNPFLRKNIDATKILIYDGQRQEISI